MKGPDELLTLGQAAEKIGCSRVTLHNWIKAGKVEAVTLPVAYRRLGVRRYMRRADVDKLVKVRPKRRSGAEGLS